MTEYQEASCSKGWIQLANEVHIIVAISCQF